MTMIIIISALTLSFTHIHKPTHIHLHARTQRAKVPKTLNRNLWPPTNHCSHSFMHKARRQRRHHPNRQRHSDSDIVTQPYRCTHTNTGLSPTHWNAKGSITCDQEPRVAAGSKCAGNRSLNGSLKMFTGL